MGLAWLQLWCQMAVLGQHLGWWIGVGQGFWEALLVDDLCVLPLQFAGIKHATAVGDHFDFMHQAARVTGHPLGFVRGIQPSLQVFVMGGYACRAGVFVALERLYATQGEHKAAR